MRKLLRIDCALEPVWFSHAVSIRDLLRLILCGICSTLYGWVHQVLTAGWFTQISSSPAQHVVVVDAGP